MDLAYGLDFYVVPVDEKLFFASRANCRSNWSKTLEKSYLKINKAVGGKRRETLSEKESINNLLTASVSEHAESGEKGYNGVTTGCIKEIPTNDVHK